MIILILLSVRVALVVLLALFLTNVLIKLMTDLLDKIFLIPLLGILALGCSVNRSATVGRFRNKLISIFMTHESSSNLV